MTVRVTRTVGSTIHLKMAQQEKEKASLPSWETEPPPDLDLLQQRPPSVMNLIETVIHQMEDETPYFRPSGLSGCTRANVFFYNRAPESAVHAGSQLQRILDSGTALHEMLQGYLAAHPGCFFAPEAKVFLPELRIKGSCDGIITRRADNYRWGVEFKTIGDKGFDALKGPKPDHVTQASIYARLAGVWWITIVYFNKSNGSMKEYPVHYDPNLWQTKVVDRALALHALVDSGTIPPFDSVQCRDGITLCKFVRHCFRLQGKKPPAGW